MDHVISLYGYQF